MSPSLASLPVLSNLSLNTLNDGALITSQIRHPIRIFGSADYVELLLHFEAASVLPAVRWGSPHLKKSSYPAPALTLPESEGKCKIHDVVSGTGVQGDVVWSSP